MLGLGAWVRWLRVGRAQGAVSREHAALLPDQDGEPGYLPERAIHGEAQDRFGRAGFARRLANALVTRDGRRARGVVVGLVGPWGSGKSSLLNLLEEELARREPKPVVVRFEPWLISGRDDLVLALLTEMYGALEREPSTRKKAARFLDTAAPYLSALGRVANSYLPGTKDALDQGVGALRKRLEGPSGLTGLKKALEAALDEVPAPVVVLIDELDRLRDEEVRTIAQLVRAVADFRHISYVLAYDQQRVEEALGGDTAGNPDQQRERGRAYLEKLVHIPIPLPVAFMAEVHTLLQAEVEAVLAENGVAPAALAGMRGRELGRLLSEEVFDTPREVLRATGAFRVLLAMVGDEVDMVDLLAFAALHTKFPHLTEVIRTRPELFVQGSVSMHEVDAWFQLREERDEEKRWALRFPELKVPRSARCLVGFLFDNSDQDEAREINFYSLRQRRSFLVTLRLGMPPGFVARAETERFLRLSEAEAANFLKEQRRQDRLPDLLDRLAEVYPFMADPSDAFWRPAAMLHRRHRAHWVARYDGLRNTIDGWVKLASGRLRARPEEQARFLAVAEMLRDSRDPHILPIWLQRHALAFGLFDLPKQEYRKETIFLDPDTLQTWLEEQAAWVREAFCEGDLLFELHHALVLDQLAYIGGWDARCRDRLEQLISQPDGIDQLALLLFGGNFMTDSKQVALLIDPERFAARASKRLLELEAEGADVSVVSALRRSLGED